MENLSILIITVIAVWFIARNVGYKAGKKSTNESKFSEGYKKGIKSAQKDFHKMCCLSDDELMDRVNEIRKNTPDLS